MSLLTNEREPSRIFRHGRRIRAVCTALVVILATVVVGGYQAAGAQEATSPPPLTAEQQAMLDQALAEVDAMMADAAALAPAQSEENDLMMDQINEIRRVLSAWNPNYQPGANLRFSSVLFPYVSRMLDDVQAIPELYCSSPTGDTGSVLLDTTTLRAQVLVAEGLQMQGLIAYTVFVPDSVNPSPQTNWRDAVEILVGIETASGAIQEGSGLFTGPLMQLFASIHGHIVCPVYTDPKGETRPLVGGTVWAVLGVQVPRII